LALHVRILLIDTQWPERLSRQRLLQRRGNERRLSNAPLNSCRRLLLRVSRKIFRNALLVLIACGGLAWGADNPGGERAAPGQAAQRKFGEIIGLQVKFAQGQPQRDLASLEELGVRWVRDYVGSWAELEPSPGQYREFPAAFKARLAYYKQHNIGVVLLLGLANRVAYPPTPEQPLRSVDPQAVARYAVQAARMMRESGVRFVLEIGNEPHNTFRPFVGGSWNGKPPAPWLDHYVKIVTETVRQVKAFDPSIKLLDDDDMWIVHYWFLEAGLPRELDGFAFHPYSGKSAVGPEVAAVDRMTDWLRPFTVVGPDRSFHSAVHLLREQGKAKLGKTPEMWITEWGWRIGEAIPQGTATEDIVAAFVPRAFIAAEAAGVQAMCWFSAQDSVDGAFGLTANDGRRRKSYYAFKTMSEQLGQYVLVRQVAGAKHPASGVQAFLFRGASDYKLVVWNIDGGERQISLRGALRETRVVDLLGQAVAPAKDQADGSSISFGAAPIYISGVRVDDGLDANLAPLD
jgi:hypothetical protein